MYWIFDNFPIRRCLQGPTFSRILDSILDKYMCLHIFFAWPRNASQSLHPHHMQHCSTQLAASDLLVSNLSPLPLMISLRREGTIFRSFWHCSGVTFCHSSVMALISPLGVLMDLFGNFVSSSAHGHSEGHKSSILGACTFGLIRCLKRDLTVACSP